MRKLKRFKLIVCSSIAMSLMLLSSCATDTGTVMSLTDLVSSGIITEDNLMNIATLCNGSLQKVVYGEDYSHELETIEYEATPVEDELTEDQEKAILKTYNSYVNELFASSSSNKKVTGSKINAYYGTYNGYIIVEAEYYTNEGVIDIAMSYIVGDYFLGWFGENNNIIGWTTNN